MIQSPESGGIFQYINKGRKYENNYIDKNFIRKVISGKINVEEINVKPGTLILFMKKLLT